MKLITDQPEMTVVSIGHRPELEGLHTREIELARHRKGTKLVRDFELSEPGRNINWAGGLARPAR